MSKSILALVAVIAAMMVSGCSIPTEPLETNYNSTTTKNYVDGSTTTRTTTGNMTMTCKTSKDYSDTSCVTTYAK